MQIKIMPQQMAEKASAKLTIPTDIVSITDPDLPDAVFDETNPHVRRIFRMKFYDVDQESAQVPKATPADMEGLKEFIDTIAPDTQLLIVHCRGGLSRSPGCAAAIAEYLGIKTQIWGSRKYVPNRHVYRTATQILTGEKKDGEYFETMFSNTYDKHV